MLTLRNCCLALLLISGQLVYECWSLLPHNYCDVGYYCSYEEAHVWAKDEDRCYVFRNACLMKKAECEHYKLTNGSILTVVDQESCQNQCLLDCEQGHDQVCATFYHGDTMKFDSECEMLNYACTEEKPINFDVSIDCSFEFAYSTVEPKIEIYDN